MNQIILTVDCKKTSHIYTTYDSEIILAIDKLLFNMAGAGVHYKSVPNEERKEND